MTERVLITGGLGYVGGRIAKFLAEREDLSLVLGTRQIKRNRPDWLRTGKVEQVDLMVDSSLDLACKGVKYILHLAALNEIDSAADPEQALLVNGLGTLKLLRAAERAGVERFIYFSTAHVYGAPLQGTITEESLPRAVHPYAISHKVAEDFVLAAHDLRSLVGIVLRLSNAFGAPVRSDVDRWTLVVNDLCRQAVTTGRLVLRSAGIQKRDFIGLSDVVRAVAYIMNVPNDKCGDGLFNLGGECSLSIIEMAGLIAERCNTTLGYRPEIIAPETKSGGVLCQLDYSIDKIRSIGFSLTKNINSEIDDTLLFCKNAFGRNKDSL